MVEKKMLDLKKEFEKICNENQGILIRTDSGIDSSFDVLQKHLYKILGDKYKLGGFYENWVYKRYGYRNTWEYL